MLDINDHGLGGGARVAFLVTAASLTATLLGILVYFAIS